MVELSSWDFLFSHTGDVKGSEEGSNANTWAFHPWNRVSNTSAFKRTRHWLLEVWLVKLHNHLSTHFTEFSQFSTKIFFLIMERVTFCGLLNSIWVSVFRKFSSGRSHMEGHSQGSSVASHLLPPLLANFGEVLWRPESSLLATHCNSAFLLEEVGGSRNYSTALRDASLGPGLVALWEENGHNERE